MDYTKAFEDRMSKDLKKLVDHKHWIICLCGSTRLKELFIAINRDLTKAGFIVLAPGVYSHAGDDVTEQEKVVLDKVHRQKIAMSDAIYVINPSGYIGESTRNEIELAKTLNKAIFYMDGSESV